MAREKDIMATKLKIARHVQRGETVPAGFAQALAGMLAAEQKKYLRVPANRRRRGIL